MPLFLSDEEFNQCSHDASLVAEKADSFVKGLQRQLETVKAQADAASITTEQSCALLEQKYFSLSSDFQNLESQNAQLTSSIEKHLKELAQVQSEKHQLHIKAIGKDGEIERLSIEASELHKSKRQLLELVEQKDAEISEKNATIKSYLDKIVNLTDAAALKQAYLHDREAELARSLTACTRLSQEKELFVRHNTWLNEELTAKVENLTELRRTHVQLEADLSNKLAEAERQLSESSSSLKWSRERLKELELELASVQEELCSSKEAAAANEERFSAEISTVTKLIELYKESSEEWSRKAGDLEGVVKALETHLSQVEIDYKVKLEKELSSRKQFEKEATELKEKLEKCEAEIEKNRKVDEFSLLQISGFTEETWTCGSEADGGNEHDRMLVPKIPKGVSGTALAASLLRDGWSLAKMYEKYQEAVDALRHERLGRKQSEAILERVLFEIEGKADIILDERAEHEKMMEAYSVMNQKLQQSLSEQANLEGAIQELKADLRRRDREYELAQKEIVDLQKQVTILLKECRDIQLRYGSGHIYSDEANNTSDIVMNDESDTEKIISERLLTFRDINGLVEQNVQLRTLVRSLSDQNAQRDTGLREGFEMELQRKSDEAAAKVAVVLERAEEQGRMIESLHSSVAMYKRLYEEELKLHGSYSHSSEAVPDNGRKDLVLLLEGSQDASKKAIEQATQRVKNLEEELDKSRSEVVSLRSERDKLAMEANFARDRLDRFMKECDHQRGEVNGVLARNVELSQMIVDYQRKFREISDSLIAAEDTSRKLTVEVSLLKHEKELLANSEKRACDEVRSLSERVHRLQASLDVIQSTNEVREEARSMEKRKREEYLQKVEREWAQAKKELQEERDNVRNLILDRENKMTNAMTQVEEMGTKLGVALSAVAAAETRAAVAEARYSDLDEKVKNSGEKVSVLDGGHNSLTSSADEVAADLQKAKEEIGRLKEEAQANKDHMLQYKSIAQVNEAAMRQIESVHEKFKAETDKSKKSLEADILSLREMISELENESRSKSHEFAFELAQKEEALVSALAEVTRLKEESSTKMSQIMGMETQIFSLKEDLEKEHGRWRSAQDNYERQVILQSETIQELTKTSQALAALQEEVSVLRKFADTQKNENDILKAKMETEKSVLEQARNEAEKKYNDVNEQNKILHDRLEALHIKLAEKERNSAGTSLQNSCRDVQGDGDMQTVVNYLRRSKEIAETEISLLKQEKLRLQSQLESALKASDIAQSSLHTERGKSKALVFTDEEFKSLQIQIRETNLLRESNSQLREENKNNLLESQKLRDEVRMAKVETESLATQLRRKQFEVDAYLKQIETQNVEKGNLENKIDELLRLGKQIDLETYDRMKNDFQQMEVKLRETDALLEDTARTASEKQNKIASLEKRIASTQSELVEREKQINEVLQSEATLKLDVEKERKHVAHLKKKVENMAKEKEELSKEKQSLSKQLEDSKQGKRIAGESSNEQILKEKEKEKDTRIQILEKTLEREREELRKEKEEKNKEKFKRQKNEQLVVDMLKNITQGKKEVFDEIEKLKRGRDNLSESGGSMVQVGSETDLQNKTAAYVQAVDELTNSVAVDGIGTRTPSLETSSIVDAPSATAAARQVPAQASAAHPPRSKLVGEKEKRSTLPKPNAEGRKSSRKLVRPRLGDPEQPTGDIEMPEVEVPSSAEGKLIDNESQGDLTVFVQSTGRKRLASSSGSELCEESQAQPETGSIAPVSKKSRGSDSPPESADGQAGITPVKLEPPSGLDASLDAGEEPRDTNEQTTDAEKDAIGEQGGELKDSPALEEGISQGETQDELNDASEELLDNNTTEMEEIGDEKAGDGQDVQQTEAEAGSDEEEGELVPDVSEEHDGGDISMMVTSPEAGEVQDEALPVPELPTAGEGAVVVSTGDDATSSEILATEKNDMGEGAEETIAADDSDKSNNDEEDTSVEAQPEKSPKLGSGAAESCSPSKAGDDSKKAVGSGRRTINLAAIARQRVDQRYATHTALLSRSTVTRRGGSSSSPIRGSGTKSHGVRGVRAWRGRGGGGGRGQGSDEGQDDK